MCRTRKHCLNVPGGNSVDECVHVEHNYGGGKAVRVPFHRAGPQVVPLDPNTLLLVLREILTAETEGHGRQETLPETRQQILLMCTC